MERKQRLLIITGFEGDLENPGPTSLARGSFQKLAESDIAVVINDDGAGRVVKIRNEFPEDFEVEVVSADAD